MVVRDEVVGDVNDGDQLNDGYFNTINYRNSIIQVYTGASANSILTSAADGNNEASVELTAIPAGKILNYVRVRITGTAAVGNNQSAASGVQVKIQTKETGGAYSDSLAYVYFYKIDSSYDDNQNRTHTSTHSMEYLHTATSGEKSNGMQVKVFTNSVLDVHSGDTATVSFTNIQIVQEVI